MLLRLGPRGKLVQMAAGRGRDALIVLAGVFIDPIAIGVPIEDADAVRCQGTAKFRISDGARGESDMQVEPIGGRPEIQHETRIGDGHLVLGLKILRDGPPRPRNRTWSSVASRMAARASCAARMSATVRLL